jgi:hypothetical protein
VKSPAAFVPAALRAVVRRHPSWRRYASRREAFRLASSAKRLDLCAAQMAHLLHACGSHTLRGMTCLEVGSGRVLSYALACHLLGAERVIAVDIASLAQPAALLPAIQSACDYVVRDVLSPFEEHSRIRQRLAGLRRIRRWTLETLQSLGIEYRAPVDLASAPLETTVDFAYSFSVLEHVLPRDVPAVLRNLSASLRPTGAMAHAIHLEDHRDSAHEPFAFLGERDFSDEDAAQRGNRLRKGEWAAMFAALPLQTRIVYEWSRPDAPLPASIDSGVRYRDEADLRVSHLGIQAIRVAT